MRSGDFDRDYWESLYVEPVDPRHEAFKYRVQLENEARARRSKNLLEISWLLSIVVVCVWLMIGIMGVVL